MIDPDTSSDPVIWVLPLISALPVILVVPISVWTSFVASPNIFEPEVCIVDAVIKMMLDVLHLKIELLIYH